MPDLMFRIARDGTYRGYNAPNERDLLSEMVVGRNVHERLPQELADRVLAAGQAAVDRGTPQMIEYALDFTGETRNYEARFAASGEDEFLMIVREITERKRQQEELQASRARIVAAGDDERRKLERNLHDGAQQRLTAVLLNLGRIRATSGKGDPRLDAAIDELAAGLEEIRELASGLHPSLLTERGLVAALEALVLRAPVPVELESLPDRRLPEPVEATAYYVVAEALANVQKHAGARRVVVRAALGDDLLLVTVDDDGTGGADEAGSGLRGLADRVDALGGRLSVESPVGGGTRLRAEIPLAAIPA
jgi:signal transduction histidine kinase